MTFCTRAIGAVLTSKQSEEKQVAAHYRDGVLPKMRSLLILKEATIQPSSLGLAPATYIAASPTYYISHSYLNPYVVIFPTKADTRACTVLLRRRGIGGKALKF
jgi:hypothetical protein